MHWSEYKTKCENKTKQNVRIKLGVNRLFILTYSSQDEIAKEGIKPEVFFLLKGVIKISTSSLTENV